MSGDLILQDGDIQPGKHDRLILSLSDGKSLVFNDTRKFGRVWLTENPDDILHDLGPEPFSNDFTPEWLYQALHARQPFSVWEECLHRWQGAS